MAGTYASALVVLLAAAGTGQAVFLICGRRDWSWLAPPVGLGVLCAVSWGLLNLTGDPLPAVVALVALAAGGGLVLARERAAIGPAFRVALAALALASLPFVVEGRFGILGTSLNPDMSQHLFAADRLANGGVERLISEGYPLGPHAVAAALDRLGPSLVQAFGGLTLAITVVTALTPLALLRDLRPARLVLGALLVGFAYMAASYLIQGAFKETLQALLVLAFAVGLHELAAGRLGGRAPKERWRLLCAVPLAALAVGSVYAYSFPGLAWLIGALGLWAVVELLVARGLQPLRAAFVPGAVAVAAAVVAVVPELGRVLDFAEFETFDPDGEGLGNLFNAISPLEALGVWPSGDFRLDPGAGFAPTAAFWLGGMLALAAMAYGVAWWVRRDERAVPAALAAAGLLYLYPLVAGTPYQEAKAIVIAAPLAMLIAVRPLLADLPSLPDLLDRTAPAPRRDRAVGLLAVAFMGSAAACSVLALGNGPVGPTEWGPGLIELRASGKLGPGGEDGHDTLVLAPEEQLVDAHGRDLYLWELRGGRVCAGVTGSDLPEAGIENIVEYDDGRVFPHGFQIALRGAPEQACPFIADGDRAAPSEPD